MLSNEECTFELPQLPQKSIEGHILAGLTCSSLIYIGKMCDTRCKEVFTKTNVHVIKEEENLIWSKGQS